ncbi:MAG: tRNA (adenosine(37)-N6)-threonylcarbamoyltransferase complex dimerization subunit type 1 TsaB, partial [Stellaceae bacterium]
AHGQAEALLPLVERTMRQVALPASAIELVAVTTGPGSFTGIRVGLAAAHGVALGLGVPLIGVTGFEAAVAALGDAAPAAGFLLVALESRRADLYIQLLDTARRPLGAPAAVLPDALAETVLAAVGVAALAITGDAAPRAAAALAARGLASLDDDREPPVVGALRAALRRWRRGEQGGPARPFYLRPPDVSVAGGLSTADRA